MQADTGVPPRAFGEALQRAGEPNPLFASRWARSPRRSSSRRWSASWRSILGREVSLHGFAERYMGALDANDALFAHYRALHARGIRFALCTNNVREWEPHWRAKLPIDELFETVVDSGFVGVRKPDPAIYAIVLERLGLPAAECVFVDDIARNVEAAAALGFAPIHFRDTAQAIAELDALLDGAG